MGKTIDHEPTASQSIDEQAVAGGSLIQSPAYRNMDVSRDVERYFVATWGRKLKAITASVSCLLIGISVYSLWLMLNGSANISLLGGVSPLAIIVLCGLFTVRGYTISGNRLVIHRLGCNCLATTDHGRHLMSPLPRFVI